MGGAGRERAPEVTLAARVHENPCDFGAVTRNSKIRREDVKLVFRLELPQDQPGTSRGLSPGAFSDFLSGPRRPLRLVPEWEASPDLEKPGWFPSLPKVLLGTSSSPTPPVGRDRYEERQTGLLPPINGEP